MNTQKAIKKRRSIRKYTSKIPREVDIKKVLTAGIWAPSGLNNQPWKFKVLKGEQKDNITRFTKCSDVIKSAPVAICVFLDKKSSYNREKDVMAVGACIQNMLLCAHSLGLATCWLGEILNRKKDVERALKVPSSCELMAVISLGYPAEKEKSKRKPLKKFLV